MAKTIRKEKLLSCLLTSAGMTILLVGFSYHASAQSLYEANREASPLQQYFQTLANNGITFASLYNGEFAANPAGGERQGAEFTGELNFGTDLSLASLPA